MSATATNDAYENSESCKTSYYESGDDSYVMSGVTTNILKRNQSSVNDLNVSAD
ncbi:hypothetical protein CHS0354_038483, partial [Potamilus streckersoni]